MSEGVLDVCKRLVPRGTDVLVDVSNQTPDQLRQVHRDYARPLYVSTHKAFDYSEHTRKFPQPLRSAAWLVVRVPIAGESVPAFSRPRQRFASSPSSPPSPVRLRYRKDAKPSECAIETSRHATDFAHRWCEIDDDVLAHLSSDLALPVVTNDRELGRAVATGRPSPLAPDMRALMRHSRATLLVRCDAQWCKHG